MARTTAGINGAAGANVTKVYQNLDPNDPMQPGMTINGVYQGTVRQRQNVEKAKADKQKAEIARRKKASQAYKENQTIKMITAQEKASKGIK